MGAWKDMTKLREVPYPEFKEIPEKTLTKFVMVQGKIATTYALQKRELRRRNQVWFDTGYILSWTVITGVIALFAIILGIIKLIMILMPYFTKVGIV